MKISRLFFSVCVALATCGCHQRSVDTVPSGSFRLVVEDMVKDETFRVASLKISSVEPGTVSVGIGMEGSRVTGELLMPVGQKLRAAQLFFIASRATDSRTTNAYIIASFQVKVEGGDGGMLIQGNAHSGGSTTFYPPKDTKLVDFANLTAKGGTYPLDTPLEIGRVDGKPVTLTVGKPTL